jgi:hypothetical protein
LLNTHKQIDIVDFFLVDTSPFVLKYWNESKFDWRNVAPRDTYIANLLNDLEDALTGSKATWKIVVGHHPISSGCEHGNTTELREHLLPVIKVLTKLASSYCALLYWHQQFNYECLIFAPENCWLLMPNIYLRPVSFRRPMEWTCT